MNTSGAFIGNPSVKHLRFFDPNSPIPSSFYDGRHAILTAPYTYVDPNHVHHTAPLGMIFDGGSIPRFFWRVVEDPWGPSLPAFVIHDLYCYKAQEVEGDYRDRIQRFADRLFDTMLITLHTPLLKRRAMVRGVRLRHVTDSASILSPMPLYPIPA